MTATSIILYSLLGIFGIFLIGFILAGVKIIRPTHRGLMEKFGKYVKFANPGLHWIMPIIYKMYRVNITEQMIDAQPQEIITSDNLNARVDAQVYFKIKADENNVKNSQYNVDNVKIQIVSLCRTTLRNIIGTLSLKEANSERGKINTDLYKTLNLETSTWGIEIVRTELKEIDPPKDVQDTMNKIVKAENEKLAAVDFATAMETQADGVKRSKIKEAEGSKISQVLRAEGEAESKIKVAEADAKAIELVNLAAEKYFVGNAQILKQLQTVEQSLTNNTKFVVPEGSSLVNIINDMANTKTPIVIPTENKPKVKLKSGK